MFSASLEEIAQHIFHVDAHLFDTHRPGELDGRVVLLTHLHLNQTVIELARAELCPKFLARASKVFVFRLFIWYEHRSCSLSGVEIEHRTGAGGLRRRKEKVEDTFLDIQFCLIS